MHHHTRARPSKGSPLLESPAATHGFTLVELLVVVTIIVVLISMLVPATEKALGKPQAAACMANMHGIKTALSYYLGDYNRTYPYGMKGPAYNSYYPNGNANGHWQNGGKPPQQLMFVYGGSTTKLWRCATHSNPQDYNWWWFYDAPDFRKDSTTQQGQVAPGVIDPTGGTIAPNQTTPGFNIGSSYMFSEWAILGHWIGFTPAQHGGRGEVRSSDLVNPSTFGYMTDGYVCPSGWTWQNIDREDIRKPPEWTRLTWTHNKNVNMLWGDGSVSRRPTKNAGYEVRSHPYVEWNADPPVYQ